MPPIPPMPGIPPARITTSWLKREDKWRLLRHQDFSFDFSREKNYHATLFSSTLLIGLILILPAGEVNLKMIRSDVFVFKCYRSIQYLFGNIVQMENLEPVGLGLVLEKALPVRSLLGLSKGKAISRAFNMILGNVF